MENIETTTKGFSCYVMYMENNNTVITTTITTTTTIIIMLKVPHESTMMQ